MTDLSMLRYSLKQCEKSVADAQANPRYWEQAAGNYAGLAEKLSELPDDERAEWSRKIKAWKAPIEDGVRQVLGERMLRRLNDTLASAGERIAANDDASRDFDWLEKELADAEVIRCVSASERKRISDDVKRLQGGAEEQLADAQAAKVDADLSHVESNIDELAGWLKENPGGRNNSLARTISGGLDSAQFELEKLPTAHSEHAKQDKRLKKLRKKFEAL